MSHTLLRVASQNRSVVAVVGRGHLQGIKKNWKQPIKVRRLVNILLFICYIIIIITTPIFLGKEKELLLV
jgi:pheromone shutdown protein TraB